MTFRITSVCTAGEVVLHLAGRLGAAEVAVLEESAADGARALDLADLLAADDGGVDALRRLRNRGLELRSPSPYLALRLG